MSVCLSQGELFMCIITYLPSVTQFIDTGVIEKIFQLLRWKCSSKDMKLLEESEH